MAIEFDCPYCTTAIRVPDAASGKKGKCPRCETIVLVPKIEIPETASVSASAGAVAESEPLVPVEPDAAATSDAAAPARPAWMRGATEKAPAERAAPTEPPPPDDPSGFVEAPVDGPPDFSAFTDDEPPPEPPGGATPVASAPERTNSDASTAGEPVSPVDEIPDGFPVLKRRRRRPKPDEAAPAPAADAAGDPNAPAAAGGGRRGRRQKRPRKPGKEGRLPRWAMPVGGVVLLAAVFAWFNWTSAPKLDGTLEAEAYGYLVLEPKTLDSTTAGLKSASFADLVDALARQPVRIRSELMEIGIRGHQGGLQVRVLEGPDTRFVKVSKNDPELLRFAKEYNDDLQEARQDELQPAVLAFAKFVHEQNSPDLTGRDDLALRVRDAVGLNVLTGPLGSQLLVKTPSRIFRCCYEDREAVYFLLPRALENFAITGREDAGLFYGTYNVLGLAVVDGEKPDNYVDPWRPGDDAPSGRTDDGDPDEGGGLSEMFNRNKRRKGAMDEAEMKPGMSKPDGEMEMKKP